MRYRRVGYRYALLVRSGPQTFTSDWSLGPLGVRMARPRWRPPADVYETPTTLYVTIEIAGVEPDSLEVLLYEDALAVHGCRNLPPAQPGGVYHAAEIQQGPFSFELALPAPVDPERVEARYEQGLLLMTLEKLTGR